ncbi:MAG: hypothetical protein WCV93_05015 [Candidatus Shapirobacteria bacterium]|jgi:hypothetical protein
MATHDSKFDGQRFLTRQFPDLGGQTKVNQLTDIFWSLTRAEGKEGGQVTEIGLKKEALHGLCVIRPENVPESHFDLMRRVAEERGAGWNLNIPQAEREAEINAIIHRQTESLDRWVDFLISPSCSYPDWLKYYILRGVVGLGRYDQENDRFTKRSKTTVANFPDLNANALNRVAKGLVDRYVEGVSTGDTDLDGLIGKGTGFGILYAYEIKKEKDVNPEQDPTTGEWKKFSKGSAPEPLINLITNRGTGWCTETRAGGQLEKGDFYVYCTADELGEKVKPRIAIRTERGMVAEVRGIGVMQNLEDEMSLVAEEFVRNLPGGGQYEQRFKDTQRVTGIMAKLKSKEPLGRDELRFMYEIDRPIIGFGEHDVDPRVYWDFQNNSTIDHKNNFASIFGCRPDQVVSELERLDESTVVFESSLMDLSSVATSHPNLRCVYYNTSFENGGDSLGNIEIIGRDAYFPKYGGDSLGVLKSIGGTATFGGSQVRDLGGLENIGGFANLCDSQVSSLGQLKEVGSADFGNCPLTSLGNLHRIGGNAVFRDSSVTDLGHLKEIDGTIYLWEDSILDFSGIKHGPIIRSKRSN